MTAPVNWCMHQAFIKFVSSDNGVFSPVLLMYYSKNQFIRDLLQYIRGKSMSKFQYLIPVDKKNAFVVLDGILFTDINFTFLLSDTLPVDCISFIATDTECKETKEILFIGVNKGEDWSQVPFVKPYMYLYFDASESYYLKCTDGSDVKNHVIDQDLKHIVLPKIDNPLRVEDKFSLGTCRLKLTVDSSGGDSKEYLFYEDEETKIKKTLGFKLPVAIPLLPEMIRENLLLFEHKNGSRFWLGGIHCIFREVEGIVTDIYPLRAVNNYHGDRPKLRIFSLDPHGNVYVYGQYQFSLIPEYKCYCQDKYSNVKFIPKLDGVYMARYAEDGTGGIVGKVLVSYADVSNVPIDDVANEKTFLTQEMSNLNVGSEEKI
jgi:hypothetical protein